MVCFASLCRYLRALPWIVTHPFPLCLVPPTIAPFDFGDEPVDTLSMATVNCAVVKGDTPMSIGWLFNGAVVQGGYDGITMTKNGQRISMLAIEVVGPQHAGNYSCIARNRAGEAQHTTELKVIGIDISLSCRFLFDPIQSLSTFPTPMLLINSRSDDHAFRFRRRTV